jgi:hypothetical protein
MRRFSRISVPGFSAVILFLFVLSWAGEMVDFRSEGNPMATKKIEEVLKEQTRGLMSIPGVVGVGQGLCNGNPCLKVFVIKRTPELDQKIPKALEGYPVVIEETGKIKTLPGNQD